MQLFYYEHIAKNTTSLQLGKEDARHMTRVLRKKTGDQVHLTDGHGTLYAATIGLVTSNKCELNLAFAKAAPPPAYHLHIAIAPTKMNDRMEWFLEKATEMGVSQITPLLCDHSERKKINMERFDKIIVGAMKQSLQFYKPQLDEFTSFHDFVTAQHNAHKFIAHCEEAHKQTLREIAPKAAKTIMLIGPEGDFSTLEIATALSQGFTPVSLGANRLRTETAGVYASAIFNGINSF
jgi:16S rRNA (uracil1498-N3)-methyltransferase